MNLENAQTNIEEWSDQRCFEIALRDKFPATVKNLNVQKNIISRYLNFYLGGKIQKGLSARDLTLAVIAIMPICPTSSEEFIWPESEYSEDGNLFFLTPDDKLKYEYSIIKKRTVKEDKEEKLNDEQVADGTNTKAESCMNATEDDRTNNNSHAPEREEEEEKKFNENKNEPVEDASEIDDKSDTHSMPSDCKPKPDITTLVWYRLKCDETPNINTPVETKYGPIENAQFCIYCNSLLDAWESSVLARCTLKNFFALAALFVMRAKAKTFQNLTKYFSTKLGNSFILGELNHYTTPHRGFLKKSWRAFRETDPKNQIMFAKLVILSLLHPTRLDGYGKANIIKFAVLSHTAYYGMGIINMLQQLASYCDCSFEILFESLYSDETAASWNRVNDFFKKYLNKEAKQHTFHWASIIESKTFKSLSCSSNYELAVVIAVFVEKMTNNSGVWHSSWVGKGAHLEKCKQLGYKLYNDYEERKAKHVQQEIESALSDINAYTKQKLDLVRSMQFLKV